MIIEQRTYTAPPVNETEILRYAGCKTADPDLLMRMRTCINEASPVLSYRICAGEFPLKFEETECDLGFMKTESVDLREFLTDCERIVLLAATVGLELDRMIAKYGHIAPSKALFLQAFGAERIEALCDRFCEDLQEKYGNITPRFSPGYGDFPLEAQKQILQTLDAPRKIGLTLQNSLLMSPTKSVTAVVGVKKNTGV